MIFIVFGAILICIWFGFRAGYFVLDRNVFNFQINPILRKGKISSLNQYRIVHNYLEMKFEQDPNAFENSEIITRLNSMMVKYHEKNT